MSEADVAGLARRVRAHCVRMTSAGKAAHVASALSIADILAVLYAGIARIDPARPGDPERDRVIVSKGHAAAALYAVLAERGFFPREWLDTYHQDGSPLAGHVTSHGVPGVECSTGSLGHGLSMGAGMALGTRLRGGASRVFAILSDGECDEGSTWEAALFAAHFGLDGLTAIVDYNKLQSLGPVAETIGLEPLAGKWEAFGWSVREVDGHDLAALAAALRAREPGKPTCVVAHTTKGKGVSFMEDTVLWHYRSPSAEDVAAALAELEGA